MLVFLEVNLEVAIRVSKYFTKRTEAKDCSNLQILQSRNLSENQRDGPVYQIHFLSNSRNRPASNLTQQQTYAKFDVNRYGKTVHWWTITNLN